MDIGTNQLRLLVGCAVLLLCSCLATWSMCEWLRDRKKTEAQRKWTSLLGAGSVVAVAAGTPFVPSPVVTVPVSDLVAPAVAVSVPRRILETRRRQVSPSRRGEPRRLDADETAVLSELILQSRKIPPVEAPPLDSLDLPDRVVRLLDAVEEVGEPTHAPRVTNPDDWLLIVRLIGEPVLEDRNGNRARFGKKKSMELLAWMSLNRDRSTRSAARTSMWDVDVAGSTFSTIVSDMRRAMRHLSPSTVDVEWSPSTRSDLLPLSSLVVTDVDLLHEALKDPTVPGLLNALRLVRDMPFAGTSYLWADLDGSTTRIVIAVMKAVWLVVDMASESGDASAAGEAIASGLRVMPGDPELLARQKSLIGSRGC